MTALTPDDLARIEALAEKATPGPWWIDETGPQIEIWTDGDAGADMIFGDTFDGYEGPNRDDALLLAAARTAIPALVAGVRSLQGRITELETERDAMANVISAVDVKIGDPVHPRHRNETYQDLACRLINIVDKGTSEEDLAHWQVLLAARDAEKKAEGWDDGVATALNHAIRNPDRITLRLEHLDGSSWQNPYRAGANHG